jgi:RNA polymerase sigma-70 factor (ECF subfamily)
MKAFNRLVERWQPRIYRLAYRYFGSYDEAMEITQKTFIRVYQNVESLENHQQFKSWIYRITRNLCLDETKRAGRQHTTSLEAVENAASIKIAEESIEQPLHQKEMGAILNRALQKLPPEQRMVIILKEYEELKFKEIAQILGIPESTAKSRTYYGLSKLRNIFNQWNMNKENLYYE